MNRTLAERTNFLKDILEPHGISVDYIKATDFFFLKHSDLNLLFDAVQSVNTREGNCLLKSVNHNPYRNLYSVAIAVRGGNYKTDDFIEQTTVFNEFIPKLRIIYDTPISFVSPFDKITSKIWIYNGDTDAARNNVGHIKKVLLENVRPRFDEAYEGKKKSLVRSLRNIVVQDFYSY